MKGSKYSLEEFDDYLTKVKTLNHRLTKRLDFEEIKSKKLDDLLKKILIENLSRYLTRFKSKDDFNEFIQGLLPVIREIYDSPYIEHKHIQLLHYKANLFLTEKELPKNELGIYRMNETRIRQKNQKGKFVTIGAIGHKKVKHKMDEQVKLINKNLETNQDKYLIFYIGNFIINSLVIHPFPNGNGKTFWILNDILLIKAGFLPIFVNRNKKNIETLFIPFAEKKKVAPVLKKYFECIIKTYKNYKF